MDSSRKKLGTLAEILVGAIALFTLIGCLTEYIDDSDDVNTDLWNSVSGSSDTIVAGGSTYKITFNGAPTPPNRTWCYTVELIDKSGQGLSHWVLGIGCHYENGHIVSVSPSPGDMGTDPTTGVTGVKWEVGNDFTGGTFCVTLDGDYDVGTNAAEVAIKVGNDTAGASLDGPICQRILVHDQGGLE